MRAGFGGSVVVVAQAVVHSDPGIMSGTPVFVGTRVVVDNLID